MHRTSGPCYRLDAFFEEAMEIKALVAAQLLERYMQLQECGDPFFHHYL